jgi:type I restriction enzyme, S subunit
MSLSTPHHWTDTRLGEIARFINGYAFSPEDLGSSGLPVIRIEQLKDHTAPTDKTTARLPDRFLLSNGEIIFSWSGSFVVQTWDRGPAWLNQHLFRVIPKTGIDTGFLLHLLSWSIDSLSRHSHGTTMTHITRRVLLNYPVKLPTAVEQLRIAEVLDAVDAEISASRAVAAKLESVSSALITERLTILTRDLQERFQLNSVAEVLSGVTLGSEPSGPGSIELPYLRVANVQDGYIDTSEMKMIRILRSELSRYLLHKGDVLLTEGGDLDKLGRGAMWDGRIPDCICQNHIFRVRCDRSRILPGYFSVYMGSPMGKAYFLKIAKQTTNLASINSTQLKQMPLPLPSLDEQLSLVKLVSCCADSVAAQQRRIEKLRLVKQGLIEDLLNGRVRVPDL